MALTRMNKAQRRYVQRVMLFMSGYVLILMGVTAFFRSSHPQGLSAVAAAILPALPIIGVLWAIGRLLVEERDEYLRLQLVRQSLVATAFALTVATVWGFLESFEQVSHVPAYFAAILWFAGLGLGSCVNALSRPRDENEGE